MLKKLLDQVYDTSHQIDSIGIGLDCSVIPLKNNNLYLVSSIDCFYPLIDDARLMGKTNIKTLVHISSSILIVGQIAFANVVSDIYSAGVAEINELKIIMSIPEELNEDEQQEMLTKVLNGFKESARLINCKLSIASINFKLNPWFLIGGVASSVCTKEEIIFPTKAQPGDVILLTKPLGVQLATNVPLWMEENSENWKKISEHLTKEDVMEAYDKAVKSMTMLSNVGAKLMHKYEAHAATDITGFGLAGHAKNLLSFQEEKLNFVIKMLPVIKHVKKIAEILNRHEKLYNGRMVETSGGLFIALPKDKAEDFCKEFETMSESGCWIIGHVEIGSGEVIMDNVNIVEV